MMTPKNFCKALLLRISPALGFAEASAETKPPEYESFFGDASLGWESQYFFRGRWFGDESAWMEVSLGTELTPDWTLHGSLFYTDVADRSVTFSEAHLGAVLSYDADFAFFDFGLSHYRFFDTFGGKGSTRPVLRNRDATELSFAYSQDLPGDFSLQAMVAYDLRIEGTYAQVGIARKWTLTERLDLGLSAQTGYSFGDYYAASLGNGDDADGFTHSMISLTLPFELREGVSLIPHFTAHFSHEARDSSNALANRGDTELFWGTTLYLEF